MAGLLAVEGDLIMPGGGAPLSGNDGVCGVKGGFMVLPPQRRQFPLGRPELEVDVAEGLPFLPNLRG
jgi:hypothetical protein